MPGPNLEPAPLDRCAERALIADSVQIGRRVVPMRACRQAAAAWRALIAPAGWDDRAGCERGRKARDRPGNARRAERRPRSPSRALAHTPLSLHAIGTVGGARREGGPSGRGGQRGATLQRSLAAAASRWSTVRAQLRPAPLPLSILALSCTRTRPRLPAPHRTTPVPPRCAGGLIAHMQTFGGTQQAAGRLLVTVARLPPLHLLHLGF